MKAFILFFLLASFCLGQATRSKKSGLNTDPDVIYVDEITPETLRFKVAKEYPVYLTKSGKQRIGTTKVGSVCELIGFNLKAFKIKGHAKHSRITGWVSPQALVCDDADFKAHFQKLYERQVIVKKLIAEKEIAIGMTPYEVEQVYGKPTKKSLRQTAKGSSGAYEYLTYENKEYFNTVIDPSTQQVYQTFSHAKNEVTERITIEFSDNAVSVIEREKDESASERSPRIVVGPLFLNWGHYNYVFR